MKKIICTFCIYINLISISSSEEVKIYQIGDFKSYEKSFSISVGSLTINNLKFIYSGVGNENIQDVDLIWYNGRPKLTINQYRKFLTEIFEIFKSNFPNKKLKSIRTTLSSVDSTYNSINKDVKSSIQDRKGLAHMKDKKLHKEVMKSLLKTEQVKVTCELSFEILYQKCHSPFLYLDPIAISVGFHEKKSWVALSKEDKVLNPRGLMSIYLGSDNDGAGNYFDYEY